MSWGPLLAVRSADAALEFRGRLFPLPSTTLSKSSVLSSQCAHEGGRRVVRLDSGQLESLQRFCGPLAPLQIERFIAALAGAGLEHCSEVSASWGFVI